MVHGPIEPKTRGRIPKWCSAVCRQRAWEQTRAAQSGLAAVKVVERAVPAAASTAKPWTPHHGDCASLLLQLADQINNGQMHDRDIPAAVQALAEVLHAVDQRRTRRRV